MRIVIDFQGAQSESRHRGIGRYSIAFTKAVIRNRGDHEIYIALNDLLPDSILFFREEFRELLPQENIVVWTAPGPVHYSDVMNKPRREIAKMLREHSISGLNPDIIHITSLFEGFGRDAVTSIKWFLKEIPVSVTLYDLIPLINPELYLQDSSINNYYREKIEELKKADLLLGISQSACNEAVDHLGFPQERVINVGTDADTFFFPGVVSSEQEKTIKDKFLIDKDILLYTGGIDPRKNIEGLISAFSKMSPSKREPYQLCIVCSISEVEENRLSKFLDTVGLNRSEVIFTGYVSEEELLAFYRLAKLFIFPSLHEGFGLPVLEAMRCGTPVIASNTSSLPEVIGMEEALFNPYDVDSIMKKMEEFLFDELLLKKLGEHSLEQSRRFSWDKVASKAITAWEENFKSKKGEEKKKPRLAYVSPLPPEKTGIAGYSSELLPYLASFYDIDVVINQSSVQDQWVQSQSKILSVDEFYREAGRYDRVLYHIGNSHFHEYIFYLMKDIPGVVVLHDFFLGDFLFYIENKRKNPFWRKELIASHGYMAYAESFENVNDTVSQYPTNHFIAQNSLGVIVHSEHSKELAVKWNLPKVQFWKRIPILKEGTVVKGREAARRRLGVQEKTFLVCSFGVVSANKESVRIARVWSQSNFEEKTQAILIFVGQASLSNKDESEFLSLINNKNIKTTGYVVPETYRDYLSAADVAIQLRTKSRGETSAAVLDSMNYGLATVINAHGSMAEIPHDAVWMLEDEFSDDELLNALEGLYQDRELRERISKSGQEYIHRYHNPDFCSGEYYEAIEKFYKSPGQNIFKLVEKIAEYKLTQAYTLQVASAVQQNEFSSKNRQIFYDVSTLVQVDSKTGIQRVVRNILNQWLKNTPEGFNIEPVYVRDGEYFYARRFTALFLDVPGLLQDSVIEFFSGDIFLAIDLAPQLQFSMRSYYSKLRRLGVHIEFVIYDMLPVLYPDYFSNDIQEGFKKWLSVAAESNGIIAISEVVAEEADLWLLNNVSDYKASTFSTKWFHLGADLATSVLATGIPENAGKILKTFRNRLTILMVGTLEPRKGHLQVLEAMEALWNSGVNENLVIVGKQGWKTEALIEKVESHRELNNRLFWLEGISDEYLEKVYAASTVLISASEAEGFGLPLIEAAQHKLPIIARDIPVFREVAGEYAFYFPNSKDPAVLADYIRKWMVLYNKGEHPKSDDMPCLTWEQSARQLLDIIIGK